MEVKETLADCRGFRFALLDESGEEIGSVRLYIMKNDDHMKPLGLMENLRIRKDRQGLGFGTGLIRAAIEKAEDCGCYKLIATSRSSRAQVHRLYAKLGFKDYGKEFRLDF